MMKLFQHQIDVLEKTKQFNKCAYYLDMGLGKTFVGSEKMIELGANINLVICQKSKIQDWVQHFKTYYECIVDDITTKKGMYHFYEMKWQAENIVPDEYVVPLIGVINYELAWRRPELKNLSDFTLMLDESSLISNEKAKRSKFVLSLNPTNVILLSGTPTAGKYEQLWSQCKLLGWKINKKTFWSSYIITNWIDVGGFMHEIVVGYKNVEHLKNKLAEYGAVFMKTEEVLDLPNQIDQKIMLQQDKKYKKFKKDHYLLLEDGTELVGDNSLTKILYERQLCGQYSMEKREAFRNLIDSTEDRLIVFYNFTEEMEIIKTIPIDSAKKISIVNGTTNDLSAYEEFNNSVTFVQYQAGAMGLNLQKANKIIYYTLPLGKGSCDLWEQSKKRIHRIGQNKPCFYYYPLVKDSIEEWNLSLLLEGKELTDALFTQNKHN